MDPGSPAAFGVPHPSPAPPMYTAPAAFPACGAPPAFPAFPARLMPLATPALPLRHPSCSRNSTPLVIGQQFDSFLDFKAHITRWAVADGFKPRYLKSRSTLNVVVCADKDCEFRVRGSEQWEKAVERVEITIVNGDHTTCLGKGQPKRKPVNYQQFLREAVPAAMHIDKSSKPKNVMSAVQHHFGESSGYLAAYRTLKSLNNGDIETERKQFRQLPMYMEAMKKLDPDGLYSLSLNAEIKEFQRLFICPSISVSRYSRGIWVETYKADMAPFDYECFNRLTKLDPNSLHPEVEDVGENENELQPCKPPLTKIPRGRPAKKRVQKGDVRRKGYNPSR